MHHPNLSFWVCVWLEIFIMLVDFIFSSMPLIVCQRYIFSFVLLPFFMQFISGQATAAAKKNPILAQAHHLSSIIIYNVDGMKAVKKLEEKRLEFCVLFFASVMSDGDGKERLDSMMNAWDKLLELLVHCPEMVKRRRVVMMTCVTLLHSLLLAFNAVFGRRAIPSS